jgi:hypothetical protein
VSVPELILAVVFAALGIRSAVWWLRRPLASTDARDHLLFAAYLTGRVGLWFSLAGFFLLFALDRGTRLRVGDATSRGSGVPDARWFVVVFLVLAAVQFVATHFLGRRGAEGSADETGRTDDDRDAGL